MSYIYISVFFFAISLVSAYALQDEGIINGAEAPINQYLYHVTVYVNGNHACGGTVLDDKHIITAAHCMLDPMDNTKPRAQSMQIFAGMYNIKQTGGTLVTRDVDRFYVPTEFDRLDAYRYTTGDIAVVKLKKSLPLRKNKGISTVNLPEKSINVKGKNYAGENAVFTGFGATAVKVNVDVDLASGSTQISHTSTDHNDRKMFAYSKVLSLKQCKKWNERLKDLKVNHLCAQMIPHDPSTYAGGCQGDSGGPLVLPNNDVLIGIFSSSPFGCDESQEPSVYTRVSEYLDFIDKARAGVEDNTIRCVKVAGARAG